MRIGLDAMGGDHAPAIEVAGAVMACPLLAEDDRIVLVGDEGAIRSQLRRQTGWEDKLEVRHAPTVISMDDSPVEALRARPDSSVAVLTQMHKAGETDACISAGNTGAFVAAAQMALRRLPGVRRPGITILTPTHRGPVAICDVGANVNCRPQHLHQYGIMASVYVKAACGVAEPRVGLLSVGREDAKGNSLVKQTRQLLRDDPGVNFIGNVEGRDLFRGICDVVVCEGFVGNVVLKLIEGMAESVIRAMAAEVGEHMPVGQESVAAASRGILRKYDFNEHGGAPLLGVRGIVFICHGASASRGIMNAILGAKKFAAHQVNEQITERVGRS